ncbi:MAG: hypothetical protein AB7Q29_12005 [Vicinamibacterales bacterium]
MAGPFRALGGGSFHYQVGYIEGNGYAAFVPAAGLLVWAVAAAYLSVALRRGRGLWIVAAGDAVMAINIVATVLTVARAGGLNGFTIQGGEFFTTSGAVLVSGLLIMCFAVPFAGSAVWAMRRARGPGSSLPDPGPTPEREANNTSPGSGALMCCAS